MRKNQQIKEIGRGGIMERVRLHLGSKPDLAVFRNQAGAVERDNSDGTTRWESYGLTGGASDLICILKPAGRMVAIEVKRPGKKPEEKQALFLELIRLFGGYAASVDSVASAEEHYLKAGGKYPGEVE